MHLELDRLLAEQHGVVVRRQLRDLGFTDDDVRARLARREWRAVRRGVYTTTEHWERLDEHRGRPLVEALAASRSMLHPHVLSHDSAALALGLPLLAPAGRLAHITRFGVQGGRTRHGVKHHRAPFAPWMIEERYGVPCLGMARTAADLAREHGVRHGVVAFDAARRAGTPMSDLSSVVASMDCWPHVRAVKESLDRSDDGAESPGESLTRLLLAELGLPVVSQFGLRRDGRTAWADLRVRRHLIEFDGRVKYGDAREAWGDRRSADDMLWDEKLREDFLRSFRMGISRVVWPDLGVSAWRSTQTRLLADIRRSDELYGTDLGDLADFVVPRHHRLAVTRS